MPGRTQWNKYDWRETILSRTWVLQFILQLIRPIFIVIQSSKVYYHLLFNILVRPAEGAVLMRSTTRPGFLAESWTCDMWKYWMQMTRSLAESRVSLYASYWLAASGIFKKRWSKIWQFKKNGKMLLTYFLCAYNCIFFRNPDFPIECTLNLRYVYSFN